MKTVRAIFSLPLLAKELTEIAARRRTYVTRVVYALLLITFFLAINHSTFRFMSLSPLYAMGMGRAMFEVLVMLQLVGICLFLPAFAAGLITQEKERDSLALLFLTELSPWQILLQKFASALISILPFMLIGMPLAALSYAYGGISPQTLFRGICALFLTCLVVAAFSLLCSAWARTTVSAFVGTYVGAGLFVGAVAIVAELLHKIFGTRDIETAVLHVFPIMLLDGRAKGFSDTVIRSLPSLGATAIFLLLARLVFVRRAFAAPRQRLRRFFRWLDVVMQRSNRLIGGIAFRTRDRALPEDDPIAWRELTRTTLGRPHYLARLLVALEFLTVALCLWAVIEDGGPNSETLSSLAAALGTLAVLALSAFSANAFVSERVNQTLEVLMTTPLDARDMVQQKARMLMRFTWVVAIPLMTVFVAEWWTERGHSWRSLDDPANPALYLLCSVLTLAVYLPLILWLSLWVGLKMKTRFRAIVTALAVIVGWCAVPIICAFIFDPDTPGIVSTLLAFTSPLVVPTVNEVWGLRNLNFFPGPALLGVVLNFLIYGGILAAFRHQCLAGAERYLRGRQATKRIEPAKYDY